MLGGILIENKRRKDVTIKELMKIILNSPEYKSLKHKTQIIFVDSDKEENKNILNRQSHTEEVAVISKAIAKRLGENEDLAFLIGLCHDLGHTPFGHDGETVLNNLAKNLGFTFSSLQDHYNQKLTSEESFKIDELRKEIAGEQQKPGDDSAFEHHEHSLRVFNKILIENNVTISSSLKKKIFAGILSHSESRETMPKESYAQITRIADKFYAFTDIRDIVNSGADINIKEYVEEMTAKGFFPIKDKQTGQIISASPDISMLEKIIDDSKKDDFLGVYKKKYIDDIVESSSEKIDVSTDMRKIMEELKAVAKFMRLEKIFDKEEGLAQRVINEIYLYMSEKNAKNGSKAFPSEIDLLFHLASLTDKDIISKYKEISRDKEWVNRVEKGDFTFDAVDKPYKEEHIKYVREAPEILFSMDISAKFEELKQLDDLPPKYKDAFFAVEKLYKTGAFSKGEDCLEKKLLLKSLLIFYEEASRTCTKQETNHARIQQSR